MRDDIHKGAPVSRGYRAALKVACNDAEPAERVRACCERALVDEFRKEVRPHLIRSLVEGATPAQLALLVDASVADGRRLSTYEARILDHLEINQSAGDARTAVTKAVSDAIAERSDSVRRAVEGYLAERVTPAEFAKLEPRLRAITDQPYDALARKAVDDGQLQRPVVPTKPIDLDEPLPRPRRPR